MSDGHRMSWRVAPDRTLALDRPVLMGILNVTPDSFSDGGLHADADTAVDAAMRMIAEGAAIIDVGGESTRPGAQRVDADEQKRRVLPVIEMLRSRSDVVISIDTTLSAVARAAMDAGADVINDVAAGLDDEAMPALAAEHGCGLILMHRLKQPSDDSYSTRYEAGSEPVYDDVVGDVRRFLLARADAALSAGVSSDAIVLDPGLGFGKTVMQNYELMAHAGELAGPYPLLFAASRKSFLSPDRVHHGGPRRATESEEVVDEQHVVDTGSASERTTAVSQLQSPPWSSVALRDASARLAASLAAAVSAYSRGVRLFRVHDVVPHRQALAVAERVNQCALHSRQPIG